MNQHWHSIQGKILFGDRSAQPFTRTTRWDNSHCFHDGSQNETGPENYFPGLFVRGISSRPKNLK
jgi:hypothetical protein